MIDTDNKIIRNPAFWRARYDALNSVNGRLIQQTYSEAERAFELAQRDIRRDIDAWLNRFAGDDGISLAEARRLLSAGELKDFKRDIAEYIKRGRDNAISGKWIKELENASARRHFSRLEALKIRTQNHLENAFAAENKAVENLVKNVYESNFYHTCFELQKGFGIGFDISGIDERQLDVIAKKPWTVDRRTFSDRIWERRDKMVSALHQEMIRNCIYGRSRDEMSAALDKFVGKDIKNAEYCAARVIKTEASYFASQSQRQALSALGCEMYEIYLPLSSKSCEVCREMNGKRFKLSEYVVGSTAPPFHPNCVDGSVTPCFEDGFAVDGTSIPDDLTYEEWENRFVKSGLTNSSESGTIKAANKLADVKSDNFLDFDVVSDAESVEKFKAFVSEQLGVDYIRGVELLENGDTALSIVSPLKQLFEQYGKRFSQITIMDFGDSKTIAETLQSELRINSQFANRPEALKAVLDNWERSGYIPKGCNNAAYVGRHEFFHLLTQDLINQPKSEIDMAVRRALKNGCEYISLNGKRNSSHEFVADLLAAVKTTAKQKKLKLIILNIIERGQ